MFELCWQSRIDFVELSSHQHQQIIPTFFVSFLFSFAFSHVSTIHMLLANIYMYNVMRQTLHLLLQHHHCRRCRRRRHDLTLHFDGMPFGKMRWDEMKCSMRYTHIYIQIKTKASATAKTLAWYDNPGLMRISVWMSVRVFVQKWAVFCGAFLPWRSVAAAAAYFHMLKWI